MPRRVDETKKIHKCTWCDKRYAYASGKCAHEKSSHPQEFAARKVCRTNVLPSDGDINIEEKLRQAKEQFVRGDINVQEYQILEQRLNNSRTPTTLDLRKVLDGDYAYFYKYLLGKFKQIGVNIIVDDLIAGKKTQVFLKVYKGQFTYLPGTEEIEFLDGDGLSRLSYNEALITRLCDRIPMCIYNTLNSYNEPIEHKLYRNKGEAIISGCNDEDSQPYFEDQKRLNSLIHSMTGGKDFSCMMRPLLTTRFTADLVVQSKVSVKVRAS